MGEDEGEVIEREAGGAAQGADMARSSSAHLPGQLVRPRGAVLAVGRTALAPHADGFGGHTVAARPYAGALLRAGDLGADSWGGAGVRVDGEHQRALREEWG